MNVAVQAWTLPANFGSTKDDLLSQVQQALNRDGIRFAQRFVRQPQPRRRGPATERKWPAGRSAFSKAGARAPLHWTVRVLQWHRAPGA